MKNTLTTNPAMLYETEYWRREQQEETKIEVLAALHIKVEKNDWDAPEEK